MLISTMATLPHAAYILFVFIVSASIVFLIRGIYEEDFTSAYTIYRNSAFVGFLSLIFILFLGV